MRTRIQKSSWFSMPFEYFSNLTISSTIPFASRSGSDSVSHDMGTPGQLLVKSDFGKRSLSGSKPR